MASPMLGAPHSRAANHLSLEYEPAWRGGVTNKRKTFPEIECYREVVTRPDEHRDAAEQSLVDAQHNPVLSAEQSFTAAQVHALLAIEERLGELLALLRPAAHVGQTS